MLTLYSSVQDHVEFDYHFWTETEQNIEASGISFVIAI
jgi:hypothetical protein